MKTVGTMMARLEGPSTRRDVVQAFQAPSRDVFLVKISYWFGR
jgi:hypothetical protein